MEITNLSQVLRACAICDSPRENICHMAPEQLVLDLVRKESDIHSFATTAYEVCLFCMRSQSDN